MPRPPTRATRQLIDPMAAFQMVHILEGVVERGTATVLARPRPAAVWQDRHDLRPDQRLVRRWHAEIVAGVYLGYDQPRPMGGYARAADRRADLQAMG